MKKTILGLFAIMNLYSFAANSYKVEVPKGIEVSENVIREYNSGIEKVIKDYYSKDKLFLLSQGGMADIIEDFYGKDYINKVKDLNYKYSKVEIQNIDYFSSNKAYVRIKLAFPENVPSNSEEDDLKEFNDTFKKVSGGISLEDYEKKVPEGNEIAEQKYIKLLGDAQLIIAEKNMQSKAKEGKYVGTKLILQLNRKNGKWSVDDLKF